MYLYEFLCLEGRFFSFPYPLPILYLKNNQKTISKKKIKIAQN